MLTSHPCCLSNASMDLTVFFFLKSHLATQLVGMFAQSRQSFDQHREAMGFVDLTPLLSQYCFDGFNSCCFFFSLS